jgi:hypothetical protein
LSFSLMDHGRSSLAGNLFLANCRASICASDFGSSELETLCGMCYFWIHAHTSLFIVLCCRGSIMKLEAESFILQQVLVFFADMNCSGFCDLLLLSDGGFGALPDSLSHEFFFSFCLLLLCQIR